MNRTIVLGAWTLLAAVGCEDEGDAAHVGSDLRPQVTISVDASVTGVVRTIAGRHGGAPFTAVLAITRFVNENGAIYGLGQLSRVSGVSPEATQSLTAQPLKLPVSLAPLPSDGGVRTIQDGGASCPVLALMIKPSLLDLLGVRVELGEIDLGVKAVSGTSNLLGNVLCAIFGRLDPSGLLVGLDPPLAERLVESLNSLTGGIIEGVIDALNGGGPIREESAVPLVIFGLDAGLPAD